MDEVQERQKTDARLCPTPQVGQKQRRPQRDSKDPRAVTKRRENTSNPQPTPIEAVTLTASDGAAVAGTEVERLNRAIVAAALAGEWETARDLRAQREAIVVAGAPNVVRLPVRR